MATQAHCAHCFESLAAHLEKRPALSLRQVEALWSKYIEEPTTTNPLLEDSDSLSPPTAADPAYKPAAISRLIARSPATGSSSSLQSEGSTPSGISEASSATSMLSTTEAHPLFVTWNAVSKSGDKRLRGCIGTFEAQELDKGLKSYSLTSAFDDTRFDPISAAELSSLECAVTLLTNFEPASSPLDWTLGTHGLRIAFTYNNRRYGATYLPDVAREQGWTKEETLVSLMRKAGYNGKKDDWKKVNLQVVRYQGKKVSLGYGEWKEWRGWVDEEMADDEDED
ncbi:AMMECR1 domain-containing protein [Ampelomyces quisqualis]|uniref:AMMECR1 domain-containing protein n=1 Tax=Ampelomyces quisqualis TaxID=50730 RepID=A0A6A5QYF9_AMPQU|nr:AMMECR1 domain-containing protein [Ampelomyces quisqualis]